MVEQMIEMKLAERGDGEHIAFDVYRVPYPAHHAVKRLPSGITKPPKFDKFNGRGSPKEHIAYYINVMGDLASDESYLLKFFSSSLTGLAFEWYSSLSAGSISDWADMQKKFRERFYIAEREVTVAELYATRQRNDESALDYIQRWRNLSMRCKHPPHQEDAVQICKQNLKRELLERMIGMEIRSFDRLNNVVAEIEAFLIKYSTSLATAPKSKPAEKKPAGKEVHVVDLKTFEQEKSKGGATAESSDSKPGPQRKLIPFQDKLPEEVSEASTQKTYENYVLTPIREKEGWHEVPKRTKKKLEVKPTPQVQKPEMKPAPQVQIRGVTPQPPAPVVTPVWYETLPQFIIPRSGNRRRRAPLPLYRGGNPSLERLQALINELDEYEQPDRYPVRLQEYVPWEELEKLTLEAPVAQETPQPEEELFWGQEPVELKKKKKKRSKKKKKAVATLSCNTISSLLGLVEHHDNEEICSSSNDVNQVGSSGLEFTTRTGRRWGRLAPANQNIIFRGEPSYQIPEPEVRGTQIPPPLGLYKNEETGGMVPSFAEFLAAKEQAEVASTPPKTQKKVSQKPVGPVVEVQAESHADDQEKLKRDDMGAADWIIKLLKKVPTRFSIWDILSFSEETRRAIILALQALTHYEACLAEMQIPEEIVDPLVPILGLPDMSSAVTKMTMRQQIPSYQRLSQREMFRKLWYPPNMDKDLLKITPCPGLGLSLGGQYTVDMISIVNQAERDSSGVVYDDYLEEGPEAKIDTIANEESPLEVVVSPICTPPEPSTTQVLPVAEELTNDK
ncbi:hypothetical protein Taro_009647, partial [Colocasia esculenta]|nr:hypothetical protein [Colocasia esculenta]